MDRGVSRLSGHRFFIELGFHSIAKRSVARLDAMAVDAGGSGPSLAVGSFADVRAERVFQKNLSEIRNRKWGATNGGKPV